MKAYLFDFNGTLYNDTRFHLNAWQTYLRERFGLDLSLEEVHRRCIGPENADILRDFFGEELSDEKIALYSKEKEEYYRAACLARPENMQLMQGAPEVFDLLTEKGVPFVMATASPLENVEFYLKDLGLEKWFTLERIVYSDGSLPGKPNPAFYLEAARRSGVDVAECTIIEDSPTGIRAAINARAGRIIAIDRTAPMDWLKAQPEIHALIHDFVGFEQFI